MISIFMGQHQPITRLRGPMRQFVSERVLNGSGITDDNMQRATDQVVEERLPDLRAMVVRFACRGRAGNLWLMFHFTDFIPLLGIFPWEIWVPFSEEIQVPFSWGNSGFFT